ncbi:MAG: hypothetical protein RLZZ09_1272, partial [Pseudomonadota bacterium]
MRSLRFSVFTYPLSCPAFPRHGFALRASHDCRRFGTMRALTPGQLRVTSQVSSLISHTRPDIPPPTTWPARTSFPIAKPNVSSVFQASPFSQQARLRNPAESSSSSCGLPVRLRWLPTPPHDDAVTFSYGVIACPDTDFHRAMCAPSRAHCENEMNVSPLSGGCRKSPLSGVAIKIKVLEFWWSTWLALRKIKRPVRVLDTSNQLSLFTDFGREAGMPPA